MVLSRDPSNSGMTRWLVSFASTLTADASIPSRSARVGTLLLHREEARLLLLDEEEVVIDARCLREGEKVVIGDLIELQAHTVRTLAQISSTGTRSPMIPLAEFLHRVPPRPGDTSI